MHLPKREVGVLKNLNSDEEITTLPADKGKTIQRIEAVPPRLYSLPKIHKKEVPLRPIVSASDSPTYYLSKHLASLLQRHVEKTTSFDVVSLFINVPLEDYLREIANLFPSNIVGVFEDCLTKSCFQWEGDFYEQLDSVAMGSPLIPVIDNFFMEQFEKAIKGFRFRATIWLRYVDATFVIWSYGRDRLNLFLDQINASKFTD
ncbi:uncharacterized protein [Leptinotarsa decemlineata]|uniref:uncharacterized protein n=1 Tax=Leptinotarsa decemlineata TaxID=7539 RepID=UPI003D30486B